MKLILTFLFTFANGAYAFYCPEANLSKEQKQEIQNMRGQLRNNLKGISREEKKAKRMELHQLILEDVLTEEQRDSYNDCHENKKNKKGAYAFYCPEANLSEEQRQEIQSMRRQLRNNLKGISREEKKAKRMELHQLILEDVLTEEQRDSYNDCHENKKNKKGKKQS